MLGFDKIAALWRVASAASTNSYANDTLTIPSCDENGNPRARLVAGSGTIGEDLTVHFGDADALTVGSPDLVSLDSTGLLYVFNGATWDRVRGQGNSADGLATLALGLPTVAGFPYAFNGATWDRRRGVSEQVLLASAARTATTSSPDVTNYNWISFVSFLNITVSPGGGQTLTQSLQIKDPVSGAYVAQGQTGTAQAATGLSFFQTTVFNTSLPRVFRINVAHSGAGSWTYSVAIALTAG